MFLIENCKKMEIASAKDFENLEYRVTLYVTIVFRKFQFAKLPYLHYRNLLVRNIHLNYKEIPIYTTVIFLKSYLIYSKKCN